MFTSVHDPEERSGLDHVAIELLLVYSEHSAYAPPRGQPAIVPGSVQAGYPIA